jgi:hypothetical protein
MILAMLVGMTVGVAVQEAVPPGWEVASTGSVRWAAPRGWKLSRPLPAAEAPWSLALEPRGKGEPEGWLTIEALIAGDTAAQVLAGRPEGITGISSEDGWTCGQERDGGEGGAGVACARESGLITLVVALGGDRVRTVDRVGGTAALRRAARFVEGMWPRGLPRPDQAGRLPAAEWVEWTANEGRVTWTMPRGWSRADGVPRSGEAPPSAMSFRASGGAGGLSITAGPGLAAATPARLPVAEERVIKLLVPDAALSRTDGITCGEGTEVSTGLPAITCARVTPTRSLYVSIRAEPALFPTLGGVAAVRAAALRVSGIGP